MSEKKIILIVDDQNSILKALQRCLSSEHYNILCASNGPAALDLIANKKDEEDIFLIISDKRMPHMTGIEMFEESMEILPDTIRVIMSGYTDKELITAAINQGIVHRFISKPWNMDELEIIVHQADEFPEKFRNFEGVSSILDAPDLNIMQKDIKKFNDYRNDMTLGKIAFHHGFITRRQLESSMAATQSARQEGKHVSLENIMFEKGLISSEDMGKLIAASRRTMGKSFGMIAVKDYGVSPADIKKCLTMQAKEFTETSICRLIGDILVAEKILTEEQKDSIVIDMTYSEREDLSQSSEERATQGQNANKQDPIEKKIILNKKKQIFFRQRAFDKLFCNIAIEKNFAKESEVLHVLEKQLIDFAKNTEINKIRDIMIGHSIISEAQADLIDSLLVAKPDLREKADKSGKKKVITIGENNSFELIMSADEMDAKIRLVGAMPEGMNADYLKYLLKTHNIIYGLVNDIDIEIFLRMASAKNRRAFPIAKGRPPKQGRNALIKYFFEDENVRFGKELASGRFDYRERGEILNVTPGTLLAQKIPLIPSIKGSTVTGIEIANPVTLDFNLSCGKGATLSKDGLTVTAEVNGRPDLTLGGRISVMHDKTVEGNVDFRTGNIIFNGDVNVSGSLMPGFSVTAQNFTVNDIEEGQVNIENNIIVKNNIINAKINAGGNLLVAQSMKNSTVSARGDVVIEKEIIDCTITTSGKVIISRGRIVTSTIHAAKGIEAKDIGNATSLPCNLFPGADDHANDTINKFNQQIDSQRKSLDELDTSQKDCEKKIIEQLNALSDMSKIQESMLEEKSNFISEKIRASSSIIRKNIDERIVELDKKISKIDETLNKLFYTHENSQNKAKSIQIKIEAVNKQINEVIKEKNEFQKWYENQQKELLNKKQIAGVVIFGVLHAGTYIKSTHCAIKAETDIRSSKIYQVMNSENQPKTFYEMRIDSISSKRR